MTGTVVHDAGDVADDEDDDAMAADANACADALPTAGAVDAADAADAASGGTELVVVIGVTALVQFIRSYNDLVSATAFDAFSLMFRLW